jgi:hypothetical protein
MEKRWEVDERRRGEVGVDESDSKLLLMMPMLIGIL